MSQIEYRSLGFLGYPRYRVGSDGSLFGLGKRKRIIWKVVRPKIQSGYHEYTLYNSDGCRWFLCHRLVLEAFVGPCPEGMECRHLNGIRGDNRLENLCWGTHQENYQDRICHGTSGWGIHRSGVSKLESDSVVKIRKDYESWIGSMNSFAEFHKHFYGVSRRCITDVLIRKTWGYL